MKLYRAIAYAFFVAGGLALAGGCSVANKEETVGQFVDGSAITTQIKARLAKDNPNWFLGISVDTLRGSEVDLSGTVKSEAERDRAVHIARTTNGVRVVHDNLTVQP